MFRTIILGGEEFQTLTASLSEDQIAEVLRGLGAAARSKWVQLAGAKLRSSRRDYIAGIQQVQVEGFSASVELVGVLPNLVESGQRPYDMHATLLGPNVPLASPGQPGKRKSKDGHYFRAIPFRHQTPGTIGQGGGSPMGERYEGHALVADASALGKAVYAAAKKLKPSTSGGWGDRLPGGLAPKLRSGHTTDIYAGMVKQAHTYKSATQNTYTTFRMISDAKPEKWQHPGIEARHLSADVEKFIDKIAPAAFAAVLG